MKWPQSPQETDSRWLRCGIRVIV